MIRSNISILFKFLLGILLIQGAAAVLTFTALQSTHMKVWMVLGVIALIMSCLTAFWFASIAGHVRKDALARLRENFSRERERFRVKAEREKTKVVQQSHQQIAKERNRTQSKANFKVGASLAAALGLGALMLVTQFVTIGLLTLTTAGGALGGYLFRARQERQAREQERPDLAWARPKRLSNRAPWLTRTGLLGKGGAPVSGSPELPG